MVSKKFCHMKEKGSQYKPNSLVRVMFQTPVNPIILTLYVGICFSKLGRKNQGKNHVLGKQIFQLFLSHNLLK